MFEKLKQMIDDGRSMLEDAFVVPDDEDFVPVPPGVTEEQLIEEAKQYVDAIIVEHHHSHHQNLVGIEMDDSAGDTAADTDKAASDESADTDKAADERSYQQNGSEAAGQTDTGTDNTSDISQTDTNLDQQ